MTADLPTVPDHVLLVRVMRWALANGWMQQWRGWTSPDRTIAVHPHSRGITGLVTIYCRDNARDPWDTYGAGPWRELAVRSVTEAVDWLVLCKVLPVEFGSAFAAGQAAAYEGGREVWQTRYQYGALTPMVYGHAEDQAEAMQDVEAARRYGYKGVTVRMRRMSAWIDVPVAADGEVPS